MPEQESPLDALPVGVATVHVDGRLQKVNRCLAYWLGKEPGALRGASIDQCLTRPSRVLYHTHLLPTLKVHRTLQELALQLDTGGVAWPVLACATLQRVGDVELVQLVLSPMRERLRVEATLARTRRAADSAPGVLFEHALGGSGQGSFGYVSAGLQTLYGVTPTGCLAAEEIWARVHPDDLDGLLEARAESALSMKPWVYRFRARPVGASAWRWHDLQAQPDGSDAGKVVWHGTINDVTRQREMELAEQSRDAALRASRAKSQFLARMSHELRTPLNGIIGFAQLLQVDGTHPLHAAQRRQLQMIASSGQRLLTLISEVLDIARIEAGHQALELSAVGLAELLQDSMATIEPIAGAAGVALALHCPPSSAVVADPLRLAQIMANLLSNAVKYNRPQGVVDVTVLKRGDQWVINVRDTGRGLTATQQEQLFQPFNRLGAERGAIEGTGLGLVITRDLVDAMGGRLEVTSQPGLGTVFSVVMPAATERVQQTTASASALHGVADSGKSLEERLCFVDDGMPRRVLCVEDDPVSALLLAETLARQRSLEVRVEASGNDALRTMASWRPDLLLLDLHLTDMDGAALLARTRALPGLARVPAVAVSADALSEDVARAKAQGFVDYWTKPLDVERLAGDVFQLLSPASKCAVECAGESLW